MSFLVDGARALLGAGYYLLRQAGVIPRPADQMEEYWSLMPVGYSSTRFFARRKMISADVGDRVAVQIQICRGYGLDSQVREHTMYVQLRARDGDKFIGEVDNSVHPSRNYPQPGSLITVYPGDIHRVIRKMNLS